MAMRFRPMFGALLAGALAVYAISAKRQPAQAGFGGAAAQPTHALGSSWREIFKRTIDDISSKNLSLIAAGAAFFAFMAIPSAFAAIVALYGLAFDPIDVGHQIEATRGVLPDEAIGVLTSQLQALTLHSSATLSFGFVIGLSIALWSARSGTATLITALNIAYGEPERRGIIRFELSSLAITVGTVLFALVSLTLVAVLPLAIDRLPLGDFGKALSALIRWPVLVVLVMVDLAALYRFAPCRAEARWRWLSWGAVAATTLWLSGSALFSIYVKSLASYDTTYGSLGAVVVLLMWLYLSVFAVLFGAVLNGAIERRTTSAAP